MKPAVRRAALALGLLLGVSAVLLGPRPPLREGISLSQAVFDRDGKLLRLTLSSDEKYRVWVPLSSVPPALVEATLLHEDRHFRWHPGVNPVALIRAAFETYVRRGRRMGGSTLTMQLARIRYGIDSRSPMGKLWQAIRALQLEAHYSKDELLEAYLNLAPYGRNAEGVGAASLVFFGKEIGRLSLAESLSLAVLPQSPLKRAPGRRSDALTAARVRLFEEWLAVHPQDADQRQAVAASVPMRTPSELPFFAPHFVNTVLRSAESGSRVETSLDLRTQRDVERHLKQFVERHASAGIHNAAAMLVDWRTMEVRAAVGSANFFDASIDGQVNGTEAKRSPGSALKPFVYGLGFDEGLIHPRSLLKDAPTHFGAYNPENFDGDFLGPIPASEALAKSRNVPAVQVASQLAHPSFYELLQRAGISRLRPEETYGLSLVLGSVEVSMAELVELYAALAHGGVLRPLRPLAHAPVRDGTRLLSAEASFLVLDALEQGARPAQSFSSEWARDAIPVAWKTGTSNGFRDAWSIGVVGPYVVAVWVGNFDGRPNPAFVGAQAAAPLMFEIVDSLKARDPRLGAVKRLPPSGVTRVNVCALSGQIPGPHCRHLTPTWFIPGKSPIKTCDIHREIWIDTRTGKRACAPSAFTRAETFEFWPSDLLRLFRRAGIPRRVPPPDDGQCGLDQLAESGAPPQITSPSAGIDYDLRLAKLGAETIPLAATTDADARSVFWFVNERPIGTAKSGEALAWAASPGTWVVRAIDNRGRSDARTVTVRLVK